MPGNVKVGGTWRSLTAPFVNVAGTWRSMVTGFVKVDGTWRPWFSTVIAPTFTATSQTTTSVNFTISNYDNRYTYNITSNIGTVSGSGSNYTVSGITESSSGTAVTISGTATYQGATSSVGQQTTSTRPSTPTLSFPVATSFTSFQFTITNYNALADYTLFTTSGVVSRSGSTVTVFSLPNAGSSATVTVTAQNPTYLVSSFSAQTTGTSTALVTPTLTVENVTANSFTVRVTNIQFGYSYTATTPFGLSQSSPSNGTFNYTGASAGSSYFITVTASTSGYNVSNSVNANTLQKATGGTVIDSGVYRIHIFYDTGSFTANTSLSVEVLMVGGGGGGGSVRRTNYSNGTVDGTNGGGGGGGGGGVTTKSFDILAGTSTVFVGSGGAGSVVGSLSAPGAKSYFNVGGVTAGAPGGGYGGTQNALDGGGTPWNFGDYTFSGGGGGGGVRRFTPPTTEARTGAGGSGVFNGGNGFANNTSLEQHTGGGGAGAAGIGLSSSSQDGGRGGAAITNSFSGVNRSYGGGGGGGATRFGGQGGAGTANLCGGNGQQGSTTSGTAYVAAQPGFINTGGGGGGGTNYHDSGQAGGNGGKGIVMIRYVR